MADEISTVGVVIKRGDGADPEVFTDIPNPTDIPDLEEMRNMVDVTNLTDKRRRYSPGREDGNDLSLGFNFDGGTQQLGLRTDKDNGTERNLQVVFDNGTTLEFTVFVTSWSVAVPDEATATLTVGIKLISAISVS